MKRYFLFFTFLAAFNSYAQSPDIRKLNVAYSEAKNDTTRCNLLVVISETLYETNPDTVIPLSQRIIQIADKALNKSNSIEKRSLLISKASALNNIGIIKAEQGKTKEAISYYFKCLDVHIENTNKIGIASAYHNIGFTYSNSADIPMALDYYHKALKIQEEIGDKAEIAMSLNDIGFLYKDQGEVEKALEYYLKSLKYRKEINDRKGESMTLNNIGNIYDKYGASGCSEVANCTQKGKLLALKYYQKSMLIQEEINDLKGLAYSLNNIAIIYRDMNHDSLTDVNNQKILKEKLVLEYFNKSLSIHEKIKNKMGVAYVKNNISNFLLKLGKINEALNMANSSMLIARELAQPEILYRNAETLKKIYKKINNPTKALEMFELEILMRDSIQNQTNKKLSIQKGFQYEYEKKAAADSVKVAEEKKVVQAQLDKEKTQRFALYGGLLLVIVFSGFMVNRFLVTNKQKQIIELKEKETQHQNEIITEQKALVDEKQKEILDSINYAKRIQYTLLAHADFLKQYIPNHFVYFNPKDIVSGDFYWATKQDRYFYLAVCDSTGHGVPGAFMSLMNIGFLSEAINEKNILEPGEVFNYVRNRLINSISKEGQKDGFDGILLRLEIEDGTIKSASYAAANNAPIHIKNNELIELPKDKMPVGKGEKEDSFATHYLEINQEETIYLYTDGYADQFGGPKGKKFKYKPLNEMLVANSSLELEKQKHELEQTFNTWKSDLEQVDDVLVVGIRI